MQGSAAKDVVGPYLEALTLFVALQPVDNVEKGHVLHLLSVSVSGWHAAPDRELGYGVSAGLATETCEAVVCVLRLLHSSGADKPLTANRCTPYVCSFLALACTVRTFEEAHGLPVPGQSAVIAGLQSEAGMALNGLRAVVERFHPESGRFIVRLQPEDPPAAWKKVRAENLRPELPPDGAVARAADGARECGRACLAGVAEIFDDLLREMQAEDLENEDIILGRILHSQLAAAMWEALVCCWGDRGMGLRGSELFELCGGDFSLCARLARDVLSAHSMVQLSLGLGPPEQEARALGRLRALQENFARAYCELFQPSVLWGAGLEPGDAPMAELQRDLDGHILKVAASAVHLGVFAELALAAEFYLERALEGPSAGRRVPPVVLPVMLCRVVCTILLSSFATQDASSALLQRHFRLLMPDLLSVLLTFFEVLAARQHCEDIEDYFAASPAALDAFAALSGIGLWSLFSEAVPGRVVSLLLGMPRVLTDPALFARLVLSLLSRPLEPALAGAYEALAPGDRAAFWQQVAARGKLCCLAPAEAKRAVEEWLSVSAEAEGPGFDMGALQVAATETAVDSLINRCLAELPDSLRDCPPPATQREAVGTAAPMGTAVESGGPEEVAMGLSLLGLPALPGQAPRLAAADGRSGQRRGVSREEVARIRGIDPQQAPEELRCAIDGKLLGTPVRSPHGHMFEKATLELWLERCGSVCPVTNLALRMEDCVRDKSVERQVVEWVRAEKAQHKERAQARRLQKAQGAQQVDAGDLC